MKRAKLRGLQAKRRGRLGNIGAVADLPLLAAARDDEDAIGGQTRHGPSTPSAADWATINSESISTPMEDEDARAVTAGIPGVLFTVVIASFARDRRASKTRPFGHPVVEGLVVAILLGMLVELMDAAALVDSGVVSPRNRFSRSLCSCSAPPWISAAPASRPVTRDRHRTARHPRPCGELRDWARDATAAQAGRACRLRKLDLREFGHRRRGAGDSCREA